MILVDSSIWIDHLRAGSERLASLLEKRRVGVHPFIIGELACGGLRERDNFLHYMSRLPQARVARDDEVLFFIEKQQLMGRGIGYVDAHLLASCALGGTMQLWSKDKRLVAIADELGLSLKAH